MRFAFGKMLVSILLAAALSACGGGGSGGPESNLPSRTFSWDPPTQYTDESNIGDPARELLEYWIYVKSDNTAFTPMDHYVIVPAVDPVTSQLVTSYDLSLAAADFSLKQGIQYHVTIRTVCMSGVASDFSDPGADVTF